MSEQISHDNRKTMLTNDIEKKGFKEENKNIFIIHGHDSQSLSFLTTVLKEDFDLNPIIAKYSPSEGIKILLEKFEKCAEQCSTVIALFSGDDLVKKEDSNYLQPRPNAIFELGWFVARIPKQRIILIKQENTKLFSDLKGIVHITYKDQINACYRELQNELKSINLSLS